MSSKRSAYKQDASYHGLLGLVGYVKRDLALFLVVLIFYGMSSLGSVGMAELVHRLEQAYEIEDSIWRIYVPLGVIGIALLRGIGGMLGGITSAYIAANVSQHLTLRMYKHLMKLPQPFFDKTSVGSIMSKINYNIGCITNALNSGVSVLLRDGTTFIFLLCYLLYFNWLLTLVIFATIPIMLLLIEIAKRRLRVLSKRLQKAAETLSRIMVEAFSALQLIKVSTAEEYEFQKFRKVRSHSKRQDLKAVLVSSVTAPVLGLIVSIALAGIVWLALESERAGFATAGEFFAYITAIALLGNPLRALSGVQSKMQAGEIAARDYAHHLEIGYEVDKGQQRINRSQHMRDITFKDVVFSYRPGEPVFNKLNLTIMGGAKNALVGRSGSGKSSIVNLLFRFYQIQQGRLSIGDVDICDVKLRSWRSGFSYVSQDIFLFNNTLRYNLTYGLQREVSDARITTALRRAEAWDFASEMPKGINTVIGDRGVLLSGGQKQRIALARALLREAPILILDEATSSLDSDTEYKIQLALERVMKNRTILVIAHRLSTVKKMDNIIVLDRGRLVEQGTHKQLIAKDGAYAALYARQFSD